jgi:hypothetical protein
MMTKHAQNRKRFGRRNFKQRYFRLTTHSLSYAKAKGKRPICDIPLTELVAVERLEEKSFKLQNIIRVSCESFNVCHYHKLSLQTSPPTRLIFFSFVVNRSFVVKGETLEKMFVKTLKLKI